MKGVEENGDINKELLVDSSEKGKTESASQQDLEKLERIEGKQQHTEEIIIQKEYDCISKISISKGIKSKEMTSNNKKILIQK